jgi:hypothetical protein
MILLCLPVARKLVISMITSKPVNEDYEHRPETDVFHSLQILPVFFFGHPYAVVKTRLKHTASAGICHDR